MNRNVRQIAIIILLPVVVVIIAVAAVTAIGGGDDDGSGGADLVTDYPYPIETFDDLGRDHFQPGIVYDDYNSNPPTTGPHSSAFVQWGVYEDPQPKEVMVHNMEHAGVIVWYNCEGGPEPLSGDECAQLRNDLRSLVQPMVADGRMIVMTPYLLMESRIAVTGWQHMDAFDEFDEERITTFIETFECRFDPERLC